MISVRRARRPEDLPAIRSIAYSFETDRIYRVTTEPEGFRLVEESAEPAFVKTYALPDELEGEIMVAELDGRVVGWSRIRFSAWNGRVTIEDLAVDPIWRERGIGRALIEEAERWARSAGARCVWLETQNVNAPAIAFYRRAGFRLCGLDDTLYDPVAFPGEVALFFARDLR
jgi:ribosomal protein S18 acetylase RimI-like enzyme